MTFLDHLKAQLRRDEGWRNTGYRDTVGKWSIGCGHNVEDGPPIPDSAINIILESDIRYICDQLAIRLPWCLSLDRPRHGVLVNMAFNMGVDGLLGFKDMLSALERGDHITAAAELLDSRYASQVGARAQRLAQQLKEGVWV